MKTQSAKAKGRRFQQWVRDKLIETLNVHPEDVESRSMGAGGEDLIMARAAREKFPYSIECKNQEKVNVWESYSQAVDNSKNYEPVVVIKRNNHKPLVVVDAEYFVKLEAEDHFILGNTVMDAHEDGDTTVGDAGTLANIDSIHADADTAACQVEYFVASAS